MATEIGCQSYLATGNHLTEGSLAEVKVEQEYPGSLDCERRGDIQDGESLTCIRVKGGNHHAVSLVVTGTAKHGIKVGTQHPESFVDGITLTRLDNYLGIMVIISVDLMTLEPVTLDTHLGNLGKERSFKFRQVTAALDTCIKLSDKEEDTERDTGAKDKGNE